MKEREIAQLRRRFRSGKTNIGHIYGCLVTAKGEILSEFDQSLGLMADEDADALLSLLKKTMSGSLNRNLVEIEFSTQQVLESEEHKLLTELRTTQLKEKEVVHKLFDKITGNDLSEDNYVILLAYDHCDVFAKNSEGEDDIESTASFPYIVCSVCPVKIGKSVMSYYMPGNCFRSICADAAVSAPEFGFTFPAFEDGGANIYKTLCYTHDLANNRAELITALFGAEEAPMPAVEQKSTFAEMLVETMEEDCSLHVVKAVHNQLRAMIEEHKQEKIDEPLVITKTEAGALLRCCGVVEEKAEAFEEKFDERFGKNAEVNPGNLAESKGISVKTPEVVIKVNPGCSDRVETRVIDGTKYILIRADSDVEVNGINVQI